MAVSRDDGYLKAAIESVLSQRGIEFEFLIIANGCSDELWSMLQSWGDHRIRLFRTHIAQLTFNLNYGIDLARAPLIARMDADDICEADRFQKQWQHFQVHPDLDVLGTAYIKVDADGRAIGSFTPPLDNQTIRRKLPFECQIAHPTVMFKKSAVLKHRGYAYGLFAEDYDLWLRMRRDPEITFKNLPEPLLLYRQHNGQMTMHTQASRNFAETFPLLLRELWLTGDIKFLGGLARQWFFSSPIWRRLRPIVAAFRQKS